MSRKMVSDDFRVFSDRLSLLMKERKLTQQILADGLGIKRQTVSLYMTGQSMPDAEQLKKIAIFFDVSADWLLGLSDIRTLDIDIKKVCECTGLSESSVCTLQNFKQLVKKSPNRSLKRINWIIDKMLYSYGIFPLLRCISVYIDTYSLVSGNFTGENEYTGNTHTVDDLWFSDMDILTIREGRVLEEMRRLLLAIASEAANEKDNELVFWDKLHDPKNEEDG